MIGKDFVLVSGFSGGWGFATPKVYALDTSDPNANWRPMDDLPVYSGITHGAFVVVGNKYYMCGGYLGGHPGPHIKTCLVYDHSIQPGSGQWSLLPDLPQGRAGGGLLYDTITNSLIFSAGAERPDPGNPHAEDYQHTWMLNLGNTGAGWEVKMDIPFLSNHMSYATVLDAQGKQRHICVGGQVGENEQTGNIADNYEYDVQNNVWIKLKDMPFTRGHASSSTRAMGWGYWIAAGSTNNESRKQKTKDISFYDITTDTWTKIGDLPKAINTPVCDISPDMYMYCQGGYTNNIFSFRRKMALEPY